MNNCDKKCGNCRNLSCAINHVGTCGKGKFAGHSRNTEQPSCSDFELNKKKCGTCQEYDFRLQKDGKWHCAAGNQECTSTTPCCEKYLEI